MTTVLVANRGEVVLRVFRTARRMGFRCAAVYSDADADAPFVRDADVSLRIGPAPASESYLRGDRILEAARKMGADLVHPGYGFLAEDWRFARDCADLGFTFVGPPAEALRAMGDKVEAKRIAQRAGVSILAGGDADSIGFPLVVKPVAGGGGKGMAVVRSAGELGAAIESAKRIAAAAFGDDRLMFERYLEGARHIEVQIVADARGNVVHLGERDCSLQRRHQKVLEESPSPAVDEALRARLGEAAVSIAREVGYVGAGTCEFLVGADGEFGFIEMNARLQVEHPVTEMTTGLDLVELQLRVAMGEPLGLEQRSIRQTGHAFEARVYAEDPGQGFVPQAGRIVHIAWPPNARVDTGVEEGSEVTTHYDPMLAKIIVHGDNRVAALWSLHQALSSAELLGVPTNLSFLSAVAGDSVVIDGGVTTAWLDEAYSRWRPGEPNFLVLRVAAAAEADRILARMRGPDPWDTLGRSTRVVLRTGAAEHGFDVVGRGPFDVEGARLHKGPGHRGEWTLGESGVALAKAVFHEGRWLVWLDGAYELEVGARERRAEAEGAAHLQAPMPGTVIAVRVAAGDRVARGAELVVVEAMKMEHPVRAPADGVVKAVAAAVGDQVERGQSLVDFEADAS